MNHKELEVYQLAMDLVIDIYKATHYFPESEVFGLISQLRRAVVSVPSNLAEGAGREFPKELKQFVNIARGSAVEIETQLIIAGRLSYINSEETEKLLGQVKRVIIMLTVLRRKIS
ncbi:four helix bundle protein [Saccharicrinis sp. FJH2]|uniref:four helix bundle protein n=1 Tax=Saccharicrinis sp. FJH65 TaxID=3344659 RepID=UPI0035F39B87